MRAIQFAAALITTVAIYMSAPAVAQESVRVTVPPEAVVAGERIWLGEVAKVEGPEAAVAEVQRKLDHVSLGPSPRPGASRSLTRGTIETRLRSALGTHGTFESTVPERVEVTRAATWIPTEQLQRGLESWVEKTLSLPDAKARILYMGLKGPIPVPLGPYEVRFTATSNVLVGSTAINVSVWQRGSEVARQRVSCKVEVSATVVVATQPVKRGQPLTLEHLELESRTLSRAHGLPLGDTGSLVGMDAARNISKGTVLTEEDVVMPDDIKNGDQVTVWVRSNALIISAPGESRGDGRVGETIPVWCEPTGRILKAKIMGPGEVEVLHSPPPR